MKKRFNEGDILLVKWIDSTSEHGWHDFSELKNKPPMIVSSIGFCMGSDKHYLHLALSDSKQDAYLRWGNCKRIALKQIISVKKL